MAAKYGNTWWGEQWLKSLSNIDYSNRLPRGRRYANNGSVVAIDFNGNKIKAEVSGSRPKPYKINIEVPEFAPEQKSELMSAIIHNPLILSKLLNRELPMPLHELAIEKNIKIFPQSWTDLAMKCSCPDWAVPCKHLAAVVYTIANEIDRNPFIIFQLHGLDILKQLAQRGFRSEETDVSIKSLAEDSINRNEDDWDALSVDLSGIDFSKIPELNASLMSMLDDQCLFYSGNFKDRLLSARKAVRKFVVTNSESDAAEDDSAENYALRQEYSICFSDLLLFDHASLHSRTDSLVFDHENFSGLIEYLEHIPFKKVDALPHNLRHLHLVYLFAKNLLIQGAYVPELLNTGQSGYILRWVPALMNDEVKAIFDKLTPTMPGNSVFINSDDGEMFYERELQLTLLLSQFMSFFIRNAINSHGKSTDLIEDFFLFQIPYRFTALGEDEIPQTIQRWISKFHIHLKDFVPIIKVEDYDNDFGIDILVEDRSKVYEEPVLLESFLTDTKSNVAKIEVLKDLTMLISAFPRLEMVVQTSGRQKLLFNSLEFSEVLMQILPVVKMYGIKILLPNSLKSIVRPRPTLKLAGRAGTQTSKGFLSLDKMLDFQWQVALGNDFIAPEEFLTMVDGLSGIVKLNNQYVMLDAADIERLQKSMVKPPALKAGELIQAALTEEYDGAKIELTAEARALLDYFLKNEQVDTPKGLQASLRPYQQRGYEWMYKNTNTGIGSIIADDMGLGKTVQVIALLLKLKEENRLDKNQALVIAPTTLLSNWEKEIQKFAPTLSAAVYHGSARQLKNDADVVLTSYGVVRSDHEVLGKSKWACAIIDESQNIKNPAAAQTKAVKSIKAEIRIAMSGTPVENRLSEYWSVFDFTNKGYLGSAKSFNEQFAKPIENERNHDVVERFKSVTAPFIMRRLKSDKTIINDLPDKIENNHYARLTTKQAAVYQNVIDEVMPAIAAIDSEDNSNRMQRKGLVLKMILALKQICNHPSQYLKKDDHNPELSGKVQLLFQLLSNIYENGEKVLIFTQFKETGLMLEQLISEHYNQPVMFLHGGTTREKREEMVENFQSESYLKTFILSIKAGGTGLNLTEANHVIHFDLWWNPAVEQQATDRAYRIGQHKNVMVYRLITKDSFEEKINEMIQSKKELADLTVNTGEKWIGDLSNDELKALVQLES